ENCPLPPLDGYSECKDKVKWMKTMWKTDPCYSRYGVNGSLCSILIYLSEVESWCPVLPGRLIPSVSNPNSEVKTKEAVVRDSLKGLDPLLENIIQYRWIHQRIRSMEDIWVEAGRSLSAKYNLTGRKAKQILVHPGVVTDQIGMARAAFSGGPLGELVQWSDLISTLHILDSVVPLHTFLAFAVCVHSVCNLCVSRCAIRVLDSFGTEPDFNHAVWAKRHNLHSPYGSLNLIPTQFYTMFPHTPDNTFLGFVVQPHLSAKENDRLKSITRKKQALVYGKRAEFWQAKTAYLDTIHKYLDLHGTVDKSVSIPSYVTNHGIVTGTEVHALLRESKVFVGLSFPYEGPAPLEALANGCAFLNPRLHPPHSSLNSQFFKDKPNIREVTSQHPYAEAIGEPYVWMVDMHNTTDVERALNAILNQTIEPYLPYEFTCEGMLQRVNILIEKQDFCSSTGSWPPLSALQVVKAEVNASCNQACQKEGLICEPAFFPYLNSAQSLSKYGVNCQTSEQSDGYLVLPAYMNNIEHCVFQSDPLLFSCVRSHQSWNRMCPCRDYIKDQIALCKACI
uniref:alpha-1,6-mannosyl-glycoprotein 6-beta-N-acetylglucosaminyltransferase n=1 Tax=Mola mola TaxID=94237 RepID=A0A3Q3WE76_MOLML